MSDFVPQIVGDDQLPEIIKPRAPKRASEEEKKEFFALFDTDSEDNDADITDVLEIMKNSPCSFVPQIVGDDQLPEIIKPRAPKRASEEEKKEFSALFDTDSEDYDDITER